ncbi:MAG: chromate efflux transporter [Rhizobiaceae bacterium]
MSEAGFEQSAGSRPPYPSFGEALRVWARVAALSFGGPAGQIAVMHRIVVDELRWIGEQRFLHALNYCMLLPGPEAQQLAIYVGWLMHGTKGGLAAGILFVLPGFAAILALSYVYVLLGDTPLVEGLFFGVKAAVLAVVLQAVVRIGSRALKNKAMVGIAIAAFASLFLFALPFPLIILLAGVVGYFGSRSGSPLFQLTAGHGNGKHGANDDANTLLGDHLPAHAQPTLAWSLRISSLLLALWLVPVATLLLLAGSENVFSQIGLFFSKMAIVTFGGAYAVLAYVAQQAVEHYHWLQPGEMLDGLGMAETTPGPLIMVVQFVGFLGAYRDAGALDPLVAATLGAMLTTWVTFVPCFLWIFLGAPFIEKLRTNAALSAAMAAITAAVVGVIVNLAVWFALHFLFAQVETWRGFGMTLDVPVWTSINLSALVLTVLSILAIFVMRLPMLAVLGGSAVLGLGWRLVAG